MKVLITGASGVLGSAIFDEFRADTSFTTQGLSHSSPRKDLFKADLLDREITEALITSFAPDWVIHCAAERRPDVAEKDPEAAQKLNATVPAILAELSAKYDFVLFYVSTDYVFDGTSAPYEVDATPNPVQFYGKTKLEGEVAVQSVQGKGQRVILRVPVLYGPAPKNSDTAINILIDIVADQSGKKYKMDHYATRYPTNTLDIASFLHRLAILVKNKHESAFPLPPIIHYTAPEPFTKYEICLIFARILGVPHEHIVPDDAEPTGDAAVSRPKDCKLSTKVIEETLKMDVAAGLFEEYWAKTLAGKGASGAASGT